MSDAVSFAEIDDQRVELLPARTIMSTILLTDIVDDAVNCVGGVVAVDADKCQDLVASAAETAMTALG